MYISPGGRVLIYSIFAGYISRSVAGSYDNEGKNENLIGMIDDGLITLSALTRHRHFCLATNVLLLGQVCQDGIRLMGRINCTFLLLHGK